MLSVRLARLEDEHGNQYVSWLQHGHWVEPTLFAPMWKVAYHDGENGDEGDVRDSEGVLIFFSPCFLLPQLPRTKK